MMMTKGGGCGVVYIQTASYTVEVPFVIEAGVGGGTKEKARRPLCSVHPGHTPLLRPHLNQPTQSLPVTQAKGQKAVESFHQQVGPAVAEAAGRERAGPPGGWRFGRVGEWRNPTALMASFDKAMQGEQISVLGFMLVEMSFGGVKPMVRKWY